MRRVVKQGNVQQIAFSDLSGGLNLRDAPENIADNELSACTNITYASQPGHLRTREGLSAPIKTFVGNIKGLYWLASKNQLLVVADSEVWRYENRDIAKIGDTTGAAAPSFAMFGSMLYMATDGKLQKYDGLTLSTVADSKDGTTGIYAKGGRLYCCVSESDTRFASSAGDADTWTIPATDNASNPMEDQVGYKVEGNITAMIPMLTDIVVFKDNVIMRIVEKGSALEGIYEVSRGEGLVNPQSVINVGGLLFYVDRTKGMRRLESTNSYGDMIPASVLPKVNTFIREHVNANTRLWHLPARKIVLVGLGDVCIPAFYDFGIDDMPALMWNFNDVVTDVCEPDRDSLFFAVGKSLYSFSSDADISASLKLKRIVGGNQYLLRRITIDINTFAAIPKQIPIDVSNNGIRVLRFSFGSESSAPIYQNGNGIFMNNMPIVTYVKRRNVFTRHNLCRISAMQVEISNNGVCSFELSRLNMEVAAVGVVG